MRRIDWVAGVFALLAGGAAAGVAACTSGTADCSEYPAEGCPDRSLPTSTGTGTSSGTGGQPPVKCGGAPNVANDVDECAVFVSAGATPSDAGALGSMANPYPTLQAAIDGAGNKAKVYACKQGMFSEAVTISTSIDVYGGFDCSTMPWGLPMAATMSTLNGTAGQEALTIATKASGTLVSGFNITAADNTTLGGSSIAVLVDGATATFEDCLLTAGSAGDGTPGTSPGADPTLNGTTGASGSNACDAGATHPGAASAMVTCATGGSTASGKGGDGGDPTGDPAGNGTDGSAVPTATAVGVDDGKAGSGQGQPSAPACSPGDTGAPGAGGTPGSGATGAGAISASGYQGISGTSGMAGQPGQGGGGGGGAKGAMSVTCPTGTASVPGASGGAGGTGGCGGNPATGGGPGGSSIALLAFNATVTLTTTTLTAGQGGNGGAGGNGQPGGGGGVGGPAGNGVGSTPPASCQGGNGGAGGTGGPGGGGQGGHSLGIAFLGKTGMAAPTGGTFMINNMNYGAAGPGGNSNTAINGAKGLAVDCWDFGKNTACM